MVNTEFRFIVYYANVRNVYASASRDFRLANDGMLSTPNILETQSIIASYTTTGEIYL